MAGERNRILNIIDFLESCGIEVNAGKNKARGNKGFFRAKGGSFRIDIAKGLSDDAVLRTFVHEFAHFVHYKYDKTLKSLDFIFENFNDEILEELIELTVDSIPKETISPLFAAKESFKKEVNSLNPMQRKYGQIMLRRINSKISRLNRYYNSPTELFARSMEMYVMNSAKMSEKAPCIKKIYDEVINTNKLPILTLFIKNF